MHRIDSHQNYRRPARDDLRGLNSDQLANGFLPEYLHRFREAANVDQTVLVQATDNPAETDFMLALADIEDSIAGVVGWVDVSRYQSVAHIEVWAENPNFKGVRPVLQNLLCDDWIEIAPDPEVVRMLIRRGLRFDALVMPQHLKALVGFARAWPDLPIVINHAGKPKLALGYMSDATAMWERGIAELSQLPNVYCKFSGLVTDIAPEQRGSRSKAVEMLRPVWNHVLHHFTPQRLMWGSDWPVVNLAASYREWATIADALIVELSPEEQAQVWSKSAAGFYGLRIDAPT